MYKRLSSKILFSHPRITLIEDQIELPSGKQADYVWIDGWIGAVTVIPRNMDGKLLVESEYSYLPNDILFQFPGGGIHPGEHPAVAANRELVEELNLYANTLYHIGSYLMDHRRSHALMHVFIGEECVPQTCIDRDEYEIGFGEHWLTEAEIDILIAEGKVVNAPMLSCWAIYKASKQQR
jgi:8-oxo-dGTP pyrophosphatase MutT (NUDIX family)